jgi:hypothetical protein
MKHWRFIISILLVVAIISCDNKDNYIDDVDKAEVNVNITLSIGGGGGTTRATTIAPDDNPDIDIEGGLPYEDYIAPNDIDLLVYDQNEQFVEQMNVLWLKSDYEGGSASTEEYRYYINGSLNISKADIKAGKMFHLVVLCNQRGKLKGNADYNKWSLPDLISSLRYNGYDNDFTESLMAGNADLNQTARIPMWGICTTRLAVGELTNVEIKVLRAMAKVRIRLADALKGYTLTGVTLKEANMGGTLAAQSVNGIVQAYSTTWDNGNKVYNTTWNNATDTPIKCASFYDGGMCGGLPFSETTENGQRFWVIYMPEHNHVTDFINGYNESGVQQQTYMELIILDKNGNTVKFDGKLPVLHFGDYSKATNPTAAEWDVIRNEIHEYIITGIVGSDGLTTDVRVIKWFGYRHPGIVM